MDRKIDNGQIYVCCCCSAASQQLDTTAVYVPSRKVDRQMDRKIDNGKIDGQKDR